MNARAKEPKRILVVDDEPLVCDALRMMLSFDGHTVETANNAADALALFEKSKFDLVMTDYEMPNMKGDELARAIKARSPQQSVVMVTAYAEKLNAGGNRPEAVDLLLAKPFLIEDLRWVVAQASGG